MPFESNNITSAATTVYIPQSWLQNLFLTCFRPILCSMNPPTDYLVFTLATYYQVGTSEASDLKLKMLEIPNEVILRGEGPHLVPSVMLKLRALQKRRPLMECFLLDSSKSSELMPAVSFRFSAVSVSFRRGLSFSFRTCPPNQITLHLSLAGIHSRLRSPPLH